MVKPSFTGHVLFKSALFLLITFSIASANKKTVDKDGGAGYTSIYDALAAAASGDTILITGSDIDTFTENFANSNMQTNITFLGEKINPDSFPVLTIQGGWTLWWRNNAGTTNFQRVRLRNCGSIELGQQARILFVDKCIIEDFTTASDIFSFKQPTKTKFLLITNTIIQNNASPVFSDIETYNTTGTDFYGSVANCTFFNNGTVNGDSLLSTADLNANKFISIQNSIFWNNVRVCYNYPTLSKYDYCLAKNNTGWGSHSIGAPDPGFYDTTPEVPSDYRLRKTALARDAANTNLDASYVVPVLLLSDIAGSSRTVTPGYDIGAYEWVNTNLAPDSIHISASAVNENMPAGTTIGLLSTHDDNIGDIFTYKILYGLDSSAFSTPNDTLKTKVVFDFEKDSLYQVKIRSYDQDSAFIDSILTIRINNVNDTIIQLNLSNTTVPENSALKTRVGILSSEDGDSGSTFTYELASGDSSSFTISHDTLYTKKVFDFETKSAYSVSIRTIDNGGDTLLRNFTISVSDVMDNKPSILTQPANQLAAAGDTARYFLSVTGAGPFSYTWQNSKGDTVGVDSVLILPNVAKSMNGLSYRCIVENINGSVSSTPAKLTVLQKPTILTQPVSDTVLSGTKVVLFTVSSGDSLRYTWIRNGKDTVGTDSLLTFDSISDTSSGSYRCIVSNKVGSVGSNNTQLRVLNPVVFLLQPADANVKDGDSASFFVSVSGTSPFTYKWLKNGTDSIGSDSVVVIKTVTMSSDSSYYICVVTNEAGNYTSNKGNLYVDEKSPVLIKQPKDTSVLEGGTAIFRIEVEGTAPFKYTWYSSGTEHNLSSDSAVLIVSDIKASDDSTSYYCKIENNGGSITSNVAVLRVGLIAPEITTDLTDVTSYVNQNISFTVVASGTQPLHYLWYKSGNTATTVGPDSNTLNFAKLAVNDSGTYYCIVRNTAGDDTSKIVKLIVRDQKEKPSITTEPISQTKYFNESATFTVAAYGNPEPQYQWVINGVKATGKTSSILTINNLNSSNNNAKIYCLVYNEVDTVHSDTVTLTIIPPPVAAFTANVETGLIPLKITFTNKSTQTIDSSYWDFGDVTTSTEKNPVHTYNTPGLFSVKLIVKGPSGSDTLTKDRLIYAVSAGSNPIRLTYVYKSGTDVILKFNNMALVDTSFDSLEIWTAKGSIPTQLTNAIKLNSYDLNSIKIQSGIFIDTVTFPGSKGDSYGVMTYLTTKNGARTNANNVNGELVVLKDTTPPSNPLTIAGTHLGADSSFFTIGNLAVIDTVKSDSVGICFGLDTNSADFESKWNTWFGLSTVKSGNGNVFEKIIHNDLFSVGSRKIWCAVLIKGKSGTNSVRKVSYFVTQVSTVVNPVQLTADAISSSKIRVSWQRVTDTLITKIRIWTSLSKISTGEKLPTFVDTVILSLDKSSYIVENLKAETQYYFGAQVYKNGMWSPFTVDAISSKATLKANESPILLNTISLSKVVFDTLRSEFTLFWYLDTTIAKEQYVGITYSTTEYPKIPVPIQKIKATGSKDSAVVELHESIKFNTKYYFALWVSDNENGSWSDPVESSRDTISTPVFTRELVSYFNSSKTHDTVKAFNGTVVLFTDNNFDVTSDDTIIAYRNESLTGFIPVGTGFYFGKKEQSPAFNIGLKYDSIPAGYTADDIKLYRIKGSTVYIEHSATIDKQSKLIYVKTRDLDNPFILLIDTVFPSITVKSKTSSVVNSDDNIYDTVIVKDNISNLHWVYMTGKGDTVATGSDSGYAVKSAQDVYLKILHNQISSETGIRAYFYLSDGTNSAMTDLSRQVRCKEIKFTTEEKMWTPIAANKLLDSLTPETFIGLYRKDSTKLYDTRYIRMYSWDKKDKNATKEWVEYSDNNSSLFYLTPGKTIWVKTLSGYTFNMGNGTTLSLKDTQTINLDPFEYTDISLPYAFDIRYSDIADATGSALKDSLYVYRWDIDSTGKNYYAQPFYVRKSSIKKDTMSWSRDGKQLYYTIGNTTHHAVKLRIPPIPIAMSQNSAAKQTARKDWMVRIDCKTLKPEIRSELYCGYGGGSYDLCFPSPPSFQKSKVTLFNRESNKFYGHFMSSVFKDGLVHELVFLNNETTPVTFSFNLHKEGIFPNGVTAAIFDSKSGTWVESGEVTVSPNSSEYRWVVASTEEFRQHFQNKMILSKYMLHPIYPNPVRNMALIRYSVPFGANEKLHFTIYDFLGRIVWEHILNSNNLLPNQHVLSWNCIDKKGNRINSGMYLVRLSITDTQGKVLNTFNTRLTYLH